MRRWCAAAWLAVPMLATAQPALSPTELYAKVAPSVWRVQTYDADNLPLGLGSGVVIDAEALVTNCHVLAKARRVVVRREGGQPLPARLVQWDPPRDVCRLQVPGLVAPAVPLVDSEQLKVGQPVYAIGNPKGLDLTMSAGLLSSIRRDDRQHILLLQTSAAISGGSSGGGLFDDQGRLVGVTTLGSVVADAQNLNFAIPADWVRDLPRRHAQAQGQSAPPSTAPAAPAAPAPAAAPAASAPAPSAVVARAAVCPNAGSAVLPPPPPDSALADVQRLPHASERMRNEYRAFLTCPLPRAFVISEGGRWWYSWSTRPADKTLPTDPLQRALQNCEKTNSGRCFVYAQDHQLVYQP